MVEYDSPSEIGLVRSIHEGLDDGPIALGGINLLRGRRLDRLGSLARCGVLVEFRGKDGGEGIDRRLQKQHTYVGKGGERKQSTRNLIRTLAMR